MLPAFRANNFLGAGLKTVVKVYKKIDLRLEGYIFQPYQALMNDPGDQHVIYGPAFSDHSSLASFSIVYNTFLGPLSLGVNYYDKIPNPFSINLDFGYILFKIEQYFSILGNVKFYFPGNLALNISNFNTCSSSRRPFHIK